MFQGLKIDVLSHLGHLSECQSDSTGRNKFNPIRLDLFSRLPGPGGEGLRGPDARNQG